MNNKEGIETQKTFTYLKEVEEVAQDLLNNREIKKDLANAINKFREASRAVKESEDRNNWIKIGSIYVQKTKDEIITQLNEEMEKATSELEETERKIKDDVHKIRDLEHEPRIEGFSLKPLSLAEMKGLKTAFGEK